MNEPLSLQSLHDHCIGRRERLARERRFAAFAVCAAFAFVATLLLGAFH